MPQILLAFLCLSLLCVGCSSHEGSSSKATEQSLTIASLDEPHTLDPRLVRGLSDTTVMHLLFEGLVRTNSSGTLEPAIAKEISVSEDLKTYIFTLRPSEWSDGTPLTAEDFAETWLSTLDPAFLAPNANQLYVIKNAKEFKEGRVPKEVVGIRARSWNTLIVELVNPTPYFLNLLTCHFFFAVHPDVRNQEDDFDDTITGNGPFQQERWEHRKQFEVVKNPLYWDAKAVLLDHIALQIIDESTALQLFKADSLSWIGSPLSALPQDAISILKDQGSLQILSGAGTHWFRFNTERAPFNSEKIRRAFALALNRQEIVDHVTQGNQLPAIGIIPPLFGFEEQNYYQDNDVEKARQLFQEVFAEGVNIPEITLLYAANDRNHKIAQAVQHQWNQAFNTQVQLESSEAKVVTDRMSIGRYQISLGSWYADILDPINFLEIFSSKDLPTNQTFWYNERYTTLLEKSATETSVEDRFQILSEAEAILMEGMPVAPLFYSAFNYLKKNNVQQVYFSPLGYLDFKEAFIQ